MNNNGAIFSSEQLQAITTLGAPMLVIAGPGSGKTTIITHRIKYLIESAGVSPADILVITFTRAAASEMESRFKKLTEGRNYAVRFGTFHSIFFWIIKIAYNLDNLCIIQDDEKRKIIEKILDSMKLSYDNKEDVASSILSQVSYVKCDMIDVDNYYSRDLPEDVFREIYRRLDKEMKRIKKIDFDDIMVICYDLLKKRTDILEKLRGIFKYILVDEFQDSNKIQYEIMKLIANPSNNVYVVGDDDQSVYGFRGARPEIMKQFKQDFHGTKEVYLGINYRSDKKIIEAAGAVIDKNKIRFKKNFKANSKEEGIVSLIQVKDVTDEHRLLIDNIREHTKNGIPYENQVVLYRTNMQPRKLVYKLDKLGIPYSISDAMPNIFNHFVIKNILDYMHIACGDNSRATFLRIMNKPSRYMPRDILLEEEIDYDKLRWRLRDKDYIVERLDKLAADIKLMKKLKPFAALNFIRNFVGYDAYLKEYADYRGQDVQEFYDVLEEFALMISDMSSFEELFSFIEDYSSLLDKQKISKKDKKGINLMTMHGAKGLEFDTVYIIDAVEQITPYKKSKTNSELEEERRMFYVAMTRAKHELYIYSPKQMGPRAAEKSRYVKDIEKLQGR